MSTVSPRPTKRQAAQLYRDAAKVIEERGLYKGWFINQYTGECCAIGALRIAATGDTDTFGTTDVVADLRFGHGKFSQDVLDAEFVATAKVNERFSVIKGDDTYLSNRGFALVRFNDHALTELKHVAAVLRGTARALERGGKL
jgi:hypothetical protein